jgi:hypothetical protein
MEESPGRVELVSVHNVDTLWTDYLKTGILRTVLVQNGSKCKVCPQSNRLCGQTRINQYPDYFRFEVRPKCTGNPTLVPAAERIFENALCSLPGLCTAVIAMMIFPGTDKIRTVCLFERLAVI